MDSPGYLGHLRADLGAFGECLAGDLAAPVEPCGDWTLYDLADHLGQGNMWAAVAVTDKHGDYEGPAAPRDPADLVAQMADRVAVMRAGALVELADIDAILRSPQHPYTRELLEAVPTLPPFQSLKERETAGGFSANGSHAC